MVSLFVLRNIEERGLIANAQRVGASMLQALRESIGEYEQVGDIRGLGFMLGVEFVEDAHSKRYAIELRDRIVKNCVSRQRLWVLGSGRSSIRLLPALITDKDQAMEAVRRFSRAVSEEIGAVGEPRASTAATAK
jgi:4-aminobutyrate aminotransferase-like enzyme